MKRSKFNLKLWIVLTALIAVASTTIWLALVKFEGKNPLVAVEIDSIYIGKMSDIKGTVTDTGSGIRKIWIGILKDGKDYKLFEKEFPVDNILKGSGVFEVPVEIHFEPRKMGISDGKAVLRIGVWDYSWRGKFHGNNTYMEKEIIVDTKAPQLDVLSSRHYVAQGGAGVVIYKVSEADAKSGVYVGENFFPGHPGLFDDDQIMTAFYALSYQQGKGTELSIKAEDQAGNTIKMGFVDNIISKKFKADTIRIPDSFLNRKMPSFDAGESASTMIDKFLVVNEKIRQENCQKFKEIAKKSDSKLYWEGKFARLPNSANRAGFADKRSYVYKGKVVDHQVHMGIDLASLKRAPVPAGNKGRIAFTGDIGIFGKTVVIDHGFGVFSSYSHLSKIDVSKDDIVKKDQVVGRTGATGLAGGDHLHYGMFIGNVFVDPKQWWDPAWLKNNIMSKIDDVKTGMY